MNFELSEEQQRLHDTVYAFAAKEWEPRTIEIDDSERLPMWLWQRLRDLGWCGLMVPEEFGGAGLGLLDSCIMIEAATEAGGDIGTALAWGTHLTIGTLPIVLFGNEQQKKKYLPKLASGEWISCFCLTEPGHGSDAAGVQCFAQKKGDRYVLNGTKTFITNAPNAKVGIVVVRTDRSQKAKGVSAFIVDMDSPGISISKPFEKIGQHGSETAEVGFSDAEVPAENRLLEEGDGFMKIGVGNLEYERTGLASIWVGNMGYNLRLAIQYAKDRVQFGNPIILYSQIRDKIARMKLDYDICKLLMYKAASKKDSGQFAPLEATELKLYGGDACLRSASEAIQIMGGYGMMKEYKVERSLRDAKLASIGAGTEQMMLELVTRIITGTRSKTI